MTDSPQIPTGAFHVPVPEPRPTRRFAFLLLPEFTLLAFSAALDPLRIANQLAQAPLYGWRVVSEGGAAVRSSSGVDVAAHDGLAGILPAEHLFVCSGNRHTDVASEPVLAALRRHARFGGKLGGVCTGASTLARAGLIGGRRFTLHWENQPGFLETFPELAPTNRRFEIDGDLLSCGGGAAATEMMLAIIARDYGHDFALAVSDMCLSGEGMEPRDTQRSSISRAISSRNPGLVLILREMHRHIEEPLPLADLARQAGMSRRHMERLFKTKLGQSPTATYRNIRLDRARALLVETDLGLAEIAVACGFNAPGTFSRHYKARFGHSPAASLKARQGGG